MLKVKKRASVLNNEDGMATIESLPILIIFVMLVAYMMGSFGVIHTGILQSIAARTYAFETFRHRANLTYFREELTGNQFYSHIGMRVHGIAPENYKLEDQYGQPTQRSISMVMPTDPINDKNETVHNSLNAEVKDGVRVTQKDAVNPVWIKAQYGICINAQCGD